MFLNIISTATCKGASVEIVCGADLMNAPLVLTFAVVALTSPGVISLPLTEVSSPAKSSVELLFIPGISIQIASSCIVSDASSNWSRTNLRFIANPA